ncbi:MAG: HD domain-containing protein [Candidatus Yanofskybacteria bacterium]|nr:HD domain-containing protein [Candidatus Yanofskybacteria bacterium]
MQRSKTNTKKLEIPKAVSDILGKLSVGGYEAFIVGGSVRHLLMGEKPSDWDITTNAKPEEIQKLFPDSFYENKFGTVGVKTGSEEPVLQIVEITTYRVESKYTDKRHPDELRFAEKLEDDLKRRDFTMNALAMDAGGIIVDLFDGQTDIKNKSVRAVGEPDERFNEDALRMMRAVRFAATLGFNIEAETLGAIKNNHGLMAAISKERIREELVKIINSADADKGMELLIETELMKYILPEMLEGIGVTQNKHHIYTVWEHNLRALRYACGKNYSFEVRVASLLHDVGKPRSKRGEGLDSTFYGHEIIGARMTAQIMDRLRFPQKQAEKIIKLVRYHLFYYNVGEVTESSVRRLVANIGKENVEDLIKVREADRIGSGVPKAKPYKLRHLQFMIDKVARDPISPKMLKINGDGIMLLLGLKQGPRVGMLMHALMNEVLDEPSKNTHEYLETRARELNMLNEQELAELRKMGEVKISEEEQKEVEKIKEKYYVE